MTRIAIVGCRPPVRRSDRPEYDAIIADVRAFVATLDVHTVTIVSGGALGVDSVAAEAWERALFDARLEGVGRVIIHYPDYAKYQAVAPLIRNGLIVRDADRIEAWPSSWSTGTWDTVRRGRARGRVVRVHEVAPC